MTETLTEISRFFRVPLEQVAYVRAIVEAYDGLATLHAPDSNRGEIELVIPGSRAVEAEALVRKLTAETGWVEIARPAEWRELAP